MLTSRLLQITNQFKQQLLQHNAKAEAAIASAYRQTLATIQPALDKLYKQMTDALATGNQINIAWLQEANRLETIKKMISGQMSHFGALSQTVVGQMQQTGVKLGLDAALAQLDASKPPSVDWSFGVPSPKAISNIVGATQAGSPLADLFAGFGQEAATNAAGVLHRAIILGDNPRAIAGQMQQALGVSHARALTIARTEMLRAYRDAAMETYRANDDVVGGWIWSAALSARTCPACLAMNGTKHPLSEQFGSHPNCRCAPIPETKSWSDILGPLGIDTSGIKETTVQIQSGSDWFDQQDESVQKQILGKGGYDMWKNNDNISLGDFVKKSSDPDWGNSIQVRPLKELVVK